MKARPIENHRRYEPIRPGGGARGVLAAAADRFQSGAYGFTWEFNDEEHEEMGFSSWMAGMGLLVLGCFPLSGGKEEKT